MRLPIPALNAHERIRETAFALLLNTNRPIAPDELAAASGLADVSGILDALVETGWIDRSADGRVTGSAGLSLSDGPHRLRITEHSFRTWCAYDALGIPAALRADAELETTCGECGVPIVVSLSAGRPSRTGPELLWHAAGGDDLRVGFCTPTVLLCGPPHGAVWATRQGHQGELLSLGTATARGGAEWAACAAAASRLGHNADVS